MMACINKPEVFVSKNPSSSGQIQVIFGPMFSGKTTELMRRLKRYQLAKYDCLIIKYSNDTRYDQNGIATHDRHVLPALGTTELNSTLDKAMIHDVIGVDEGQFGFAEILNLVPLAESVVKLTAVCMQCYGEASFTKRKGTETALEVIGGAEKYMAVCRACYQEPGQVSPACSPNHKALKSSQTRRSADRSSIGKHSFGVDLTNTMDLSQ
ncbi:hypothetical protein LSH36_6g10003 [Paralvinella palmiformis]|uniref:Thymidine kinase n=1 Tax=Paralvinella palmiformis TaxID=53620 RepID=A0AAD9KFM5_9ANNE|nr:hypothetical protein LSH36_6g10003 [Paralvinella palmiformis]